MASLRDAIAYICKNYPHKDELSNARVTKMVYLADWKSAIERGEQLTGITWRFDQYGPFVYDVLDAAREDPAFEIIPTRNMYGSQKDLLKVEDDVDYPSLSGDDIEVLDFVIGQSASMTWSQFIKLVYSTYPIVTQERHSKLDLIKLAQEYEEVAPLLDAKE
jgi:hypothetical protein